MGYEGGMEFHTNLIEKLTGKVIGTSWTEQVNIFQNNKSEIKQTCKSHSYKQVK